MAAIRFDETEDLIDICLDNVFKAVFARDTAESRGALSALLSAVTGRELRVAALTINEPPIDNLRDRQILTEELSKVEVVIEKPVGKMSGAEHWAVFFRYITDKGKRKKINEVMESEEGIAMAGEVLVRISRDEVERARLMSEYKYVVDTQSKVVQAKREGIREGILKGEQKKALEFAQRLKRRGVAAEQIAEDTGLTLKQIDEV
ncbi:MAG: hypothetical protein LBR93_03975 [Treponema sp.]|jgi:hypothetical protein|nr:hypothetical protein [Treponema sp.]